ncbi:protein of unknown function (DUF4192) [Nocardia amikacinitolerans]|uniref:DUF4192 domain-containing protein n=1 Tax=Nocardia amikacinitolerans TaxID=756689 RepID=UPI000A02D4EE|nr:DUF4192 domain-containing protein [Nocardia amikacinitolerans]MCP2316081.1 protein of unknown function (DUF4192) [Nocardia amikacinitolerans]
MTTSANPPLGAGARRGGEGSEPVDPPGRYPGDPTRAEHPPGPHRRPPRQRLCLRPSTVGSRTRQTGNDDDPAPSAVFAQPSPLYRAGYSAKPLRVDDPGELIAALPAMVGFYPHRSLVVAVLGPAEPGASHGIAAVLRFDLEPVGPRRGLVGSFADLIGQICAAERATETLAVVVDDRLGGPLGKAGRGRRGSPPEALIAALAKRLGADGIRVGGAWAVPAIEEDRPWWSLLDGSERGTVPDPSASTVALAHVLDGRPILGSRSELTERVAEDAALCAEVGVQLDSAVAVARDRFARAVRHDDLTGYRRRALEHVLWQVANIESGAVLAAPEIAEVVAALRDRVVRDAMFALAASDHAAAAERLWLTLVRGLPSGRDRAEVAALLGYSAYFRGDGPFAGIALEAALEADPGNAMAILLETSLRAGMRPEQLRRLARSGYDAAAWLGVDLGPVVR